MIFYADVYFLINFTVDILALYFASSLSKVRTTVRRILALAFLGAIFAVIAVLFFYDFLRELLLAAVYFFLIFVFAPKGCGAYRRFRFTVIFALLEALIGGVVSFGYDFLDRHFNVLEYSEFSESPDRRLLILALLVLLCIGVLRLMSLFFTYTATEKSVVVELGLFNKKIKVEALVDTGNLLTDPVSERPVMLIKIDKAYKLYDKFPLGSHDLAKINRELSNRISLIPTASVGGGGLLVGVRPDEACTVSEEGKSGELLDIIIAVDKERGTFGGFEALMPASALDGIKMK